VHKGNRRLQLVFLLLFKTGGYGSSNDGHAGPRAPPSWAPVQPPQLPCAWARGGGAPMQLLFGFMHCYAHVSTALMLMLMLELGVETCIRCGDTDAGAGS
jgi:hypothetical protein